MALNMHQSFSGKSIFVTGITGFVGKVFLWKVLKEFPDVGNIYCLTRPNAKKKRTPQDRIKTEVLGAECFDFLRKAIGDDEFNRRASKVIAVPGDIVENRLGMSDIDYERVCADVHFIFHIAATVDFHEKINLSAQMNILGSLRVMSVAHKCPKLEAYLHTSTCYVNWNRHSKLAEQPVREQVYPLPFDPEAMTKYVLSLHESQIEDETKRILGKYRFPNTYTFTKSIAEHILDRRKGKLPLVILRPAIIGCSWREPTPGWCDVLTAAGGIFITSGLGLVKELYCRPDKPADVVPVDYVVNTMLKAVYRCYNVTATQRAALAHAPAAAMETTRQVIVEAKQASSTPTDVLLAAAGTVPVGSIVAPVAPAPMSPIGDATTDVDGVSVPIGTFVIQSSTSSSLNYCTWGVSRDGITAHISKYPYPKAISPISLNLVDNKTEYLARFYVLRVAPLYVAQTVAGLPVVGNKKQKKLLEKLDRAVRRGTDMQFQFEPFMVNSWRFDDTNAKALDDSLSEEEQKTFTTDVYDINWFHYCAAYAYGIGKFILKDSNRPAPVLPESGLQQYVKSTL